MKYLFINLAEKNGGYENTHRCLHTTPGNDILYAAQRYAAEFWGEHDYHKGGIWCFEGGGIEISVTSVVEITKAEYQWLHRLFYGGEYLSSDYSDYLKSTES
jgi:hypothetical protein